MERFVLTDAQWEKMQPFVVVTDLRAEAVGAFVTRASVIHRDPTGRLQPRVQHVARFGKEVVLSGD